MTQEEIKNNEEQTNQDEVISEESVTPTAIEPSKDEKTWAMLCHVLSLAGLIGIPLGNIVGPLIMWLIKKDESEFVNRHGKESLNFQISLFIYALVSAALTIILIGIIGLLGILVIFLVFVIKASMAANKGEEFSYPLTIRFIK